MTIFDWLVVGTYMVGMLAVGWYYARKTKSTEEYLLGGRKIGSTSIGLSLFASLMSTVSYLARPGEMIAHGPMIAADVLCNPLVYLIVGYGLIPYLMKQPATTAYEILERRLGLGIRLLGSTLFLVLRLIWMGMVIYVTSSQILVPLTRLPPAASPFVCIAIGLITVIYTSWGGLRAVVVTDVIQSLILLSGTVLTLLIVSLRMGGVSEWWPQEWPKHWDTFQLGFDTTARATVLGAVTSALAWWICTAGSDQVAIQRYFATRDVRAARTALGVSLTASVISVGLLSLVGLALLAYFQGHPDHLAPGSSVDHNADKLFPRFIAIGFPPGITGLIIAGLLAAAMSGLSAGINSISSVVSVDFLDRLGHVPGSDARHMRRTKAISWGVGGLAIVFSTIMGYVEGNLMEQSYRASNLLVAPLFMLFFMALFVPWATWLGTLAAASASLAVAVGVAYFHLGGVSFLWIIPAALLAGVVVGPIISLVPIGRRAAFAPEAD